MKRTMSWNNANIPLRSHKNQQLYVAMSYVPSRQTAVIFLIRIYFIWKVILNVNEHSIGFFGEIQPQRARSY